MVALIVILTIIVFIVVDLILRTLMRRMHESKLRKEREEALDIGLKLDFTEEAKSLTRVEVKEPKAKILAVDDEKIILDSFRKILVLAGYSIDTVESGKEALGLIRKNDYDFVFTDLKMPEMDGVEVTKSVKHLRPDMDVIVITGYATVETAVETMKFGAMDYVQKPFTEDELIEFINKLLIKRQDRIQRQMKPKVRLITPTIKESTLKNEFNVPSGIFIAPEHTWVSIEMDGTARIGIDDFVRKILGKIDKVELPELEKKIKKGEALFRITRENQQFDFPTPVSGKVTMINTEHIDHPEWFVAKPFELSWMCCIEPLNLSDDLHSLKIGQGTIAWYEKEIEKFDEIIKKTEEDNTKVSESSGVKVDAEEKLKSENMWREFAKTFLNN